MENEDIFHAARALAPALRAEFLENACLGDPARIHLLEKMLAADSGGAMERPAFETGSEFRPGPMGGSLEGKDFGSYHIEKLISRGGMGIVYLALQQNPKRKVALKLLRPSLASPILTARFQMEAQILGRLQHPGIAQIYEAGSVECDEGVQPFLSMEWIDGLTLHEYLQAKRPSIRERLALLAQIADAVHYAHQKGILHRDLKPANVLIDRAGRPKILDFGVARALDENLHRQTVFSEAGLVLGTLPYMGPERISGDARDADIRSDLYSLGVMGYEMLAGRLPHVIDGKPLTQAIRSITEQEAPKLGSVDRRFRGDIETILAKCLEKDPRRRYDSASDLAADLRRFLHDQPIAARAPSAWYLFAKFSARHKALVAGCAGIVLSLIGGLLAVSHQSRKATQNAEYLAEMIRTVEVAQLDPGGDTAQMAADRAREALVRFPDSPELLSDLMHILGVMALNSGDLEAASSRLQAALDSYGKVANPSDLKLGRLHYAYGQVLFARGEFEAADKSFAQAVDRFAASIGREHWLYGMAQGKWGQTLFRLGDSKRAEAALLEGDAILQKTWGPRDARVLAAHQLLLDLYRGTNQMEKLEEYRRQRLKEF